MPGPDEREEEVLVLVDDEGQAFELTPIDPEDIEFDDEEQLGLPLEPEDEE